ncbi:MAG: SusC/RagA family TonB-linked outer membrane protein [Bacteroidetes bacterium]|nr:SusC/RagA family TonB-linked outer membrane protein [Bacteroidota bacterium]
MRKLLYTFVVLFSMSLAANAQVRTLKGKVGDQNSAPLQGVTVRLQGKAEKAAITNEKGEYEIKAATGDFLLFSSVGFRTERIKVTAAGTLNVTLTEQVNIMDEVVVTAGGVKTKRKEIGTTSSIIKAESLVAGKSTSIAGGLQGKVAGLQVSNTGGGINPNFRLVLRGQRSLTGNNEALLVLDNVIVPSSMLGNLNPEDVEDIVVLNGSGAAALYGSQASNGALIVTTKKGKNGVTQVGFSQTTTVESVAFFPKIQERFGAGGSGYGVDLQGFGNFSYLENQSYGPAFDGSKRPLGPPLADGSQDSTYYQFYPGHNDFWNQGLINQTDFNVSNGDANSTMYFSAQYVGQSGTTPGDLYNRSNVRLNGTRRIGNTINLSYSTSYTQNRYDITTATGSMYDQMLNMPVNVDITRYKDWQNDKFANPNGFYNPWYPNPYFTAANNRSATRNDYLTANVELKFTPVKGLDFVARQGITTRNYSNKNTTGAFKFTDYAKHTDASSKSDIAASVSDGMGYSTQLLTDFFTQYKKTISDFSLNVILGGQWKQDQSKGINVSANGLVVPGLFNVNNGVGTPGASESNSLSHSMGAYSKGTFGYKNYLYLTVSGRKDWVSILAPENRTFFYPAAEMSFIASDALDFLKNSRTISYLKLRGGWSKVGQVNLGPYALLPTFSPASGFPFGSQAGYTVGNTLVSNNLKPEITKGYEVGFDLNMFDDRFTSNVSFFHTNTTNQTVSTGVSGTTGFTSLRTNTGETMSEGLEVTTHVTPIRTKDWNVTVGGIYTLLKNEVVSISADLPRLGLTGSGVGSYAVAGQPFPVIMGYDYKRDASGHVIVDATTGLPTQSDTISNLGNAQAKHKLSLDGSIKYKAFTLSFLFEYRGGYQIFNQIGSGMDWSGTGWRTALYDRKRFVFPNSVIADPANPGKYVTNTNIEIANGNGNNGFWTDGINRGVTSNYVTSADFWKLRELSLAYNVPSKLLANSKFIKGCTVSLQGRNLLVWMAPDNYYTDPEYSSAGSTSNGIGLSGYETPPSRYYGATVSFKF